MDNEETRTVLKHEVYDNAASVLVILDTAPASKTIFFTQKNDDVGAVSVRKRSCTAKILKVVSLLAERFLGHSSLLVV